jgi:low affinity Fe/Cu permease
MDVIDKVIQVTVKVNRYEAEADALTDCMVILNGCNGDIEAAKEKIRELCRQAQKNAIQESIRLEQYRPETQTSH